jgi:hypothetical protein
MSPMRRDLDLYQRATMALSLIMVVLGVAMIVFAVAGGGGPVSYGVVLGALFVAAGAGRFWVARR